MLLIKSGKRALNSRGACPRCRWITRRTDRGGREYTPLLPDGPPDFLSALQPGSTWDRLREIKARYDPTNLFQSNQNSKPAEPVAA